jgi:hypothetical protein
MSKEKEHASPNTRNLIMTLSFDLRGVCKGYNEIRYQDRPSSETSRYIKETCHTKCREPVPEFYMKL